ncbi:MAG: ParB/RepB/Spo0J family partition protein [Gammaproteobacteria bacterium]|nr:ParB/RepB/Spo0J family partition protein [Gammaproteobacteria bacterium]
MQQATATAASPETRLIPLNKLRHDDRNARSASDDPARIQADAEMVASIKALGLLENLVVTPRTKTTFGVAAGARRLRALNALAADKHIPKNHPVPCLVVDGDAAAESSLAENVVRIAMHPADQVVAFSRLAREGATPEQIAARFGVAERTVQKRVRLGGLPDEIIAAYREGRITTDTAEAFAVTADTEFQRNIFRGLAESGQLHGHAVRQAIGQRRTRSDAPMALYVGLDAYRAAGGKVEDPLFEDDYVAILDPDLMEELALQKLNAVAATYADDWKWTAAQIEFTWLDQQNHLIADADERAAFTEAETAALAEAEERIEQAHGRLDTFDSDLDAAGRRELWAIVTREQKRYAEIERARADRDAYSEAVRANAGVVVALDRDGDLDIHRGLVRAEDAASYRAARAGDANGSAGTATAPGATDAAPPAKKHGGWTDALRNDLRIMRSAAVRRSLAGDPAVATDLIGFVLARMVGFGRRHPGYETPILSIRQEYQGLYASDAMKASETMKHLDPVPAVDLGWLAEEDAAASFRAYRALPDEDRASVLAHAVASLTVPRLSDDQDASGAHEEAVRNLGIDFPAELGAVDAKPFDADLVWNRMNKGLILGAATAALGDDWARKHGALRKKDLADAAAEAFRHDPARDAEADAAAVRWLPPGFVAADVDADAAPPVEPPADDSAESAPETDASGADAEPAPGDASIDATADATPSEPPADEPTAADGNGALPAFLTS